MDIGRGEERVRCMERVTWKLTLLDSGMSQEAQKGALYQPRGVGWGEEGVGKGIQEGEDVCMSTVNSC